MLREVLIEVTGEEPESLHICLFGTGQDSCVSEKSDIDVIAFRSKPENKMWSEFRSQEERQAMVERTIKKVAGRLTDMERSRRYSISRVRDCSFKSTIEFEFWDRGVDLHISELFDMESSRLMMDCLFRAQLYQKCF